MSIVIVHGAKASGKTRHGQQLMKHFGCKRIVDDWNERIPLTDGDLALTNMEPPFSVDGARVVDFSKFDEQKATAYYKAGMLKQAPPWVPATVRVLREQFGDHPFRGAGVSAGDHECHCNKWGAVSVTDRAGDRLGLRLDEFEPLTWRENEVTS